MIGEVDGGRSRGAASGESNDVATPGAYRVIKIAPQAATPRGIGNELTLQDSETRAAAIEVKDLTHNRIDEPVNVACTDSIAIPIDSDEASPGSVAAVLEDNSGRTGIQNRIGAAPEKQSFEPTRCRPQSRRAPDLSEIREGDRNHDCQHREHQKDLDQRHADVCRTTRPLSIHIYLLICLSNRLSAAAGKPARTAEKNAAPKGRIPSTL
jgi:hypothetical protein